MYIDSNKFSKTFYFYTLIYHNILYVKIKNKKISERLFIIQLVSKIYIDIYVLCDIENVIPHNVDSSILISQSNTMPIHNAINNIT